MTRAAVCFLLLALSQSVWAEVYTWRDPRSGERRFSNAAPAWYQPHAATSGPRTVVTLGSKIIDDTALPLAKRFELQRRGR